MNDIQEESKKYGGGGSSDYFKFENKGIYKMRVLHQPKVIATHFFGKGNPAVVCVGVDEGCTHHGEGADRPSIKLATYIIDRNDNKVKMAELPLSISYSLNDLQEDEDFAFSDFPMEYDIKITYDPDNKDPKAKYRLAPSPNKAELTEEEQIALAEALKKQTPEQYVERKKAKQVGGVSQRNDAPAGVDYPHDDINPDDIPF